MVGSRPSATVRNSLRPMSCCDRSRTCLRSSSNIAWLLQRRHVDALGRRRGDDERDHGHAQGLGLEPLVQSVQRLDEDVEALVAILVSAGREDVERACPGRTCSCGKKCPITNSWISSLYWRCRFWNSCGAANRSMFSPLGSTALGLAAEELLGLHGGDVGDGREDVRRMAAARSSLYRCSNPCSRATARAVDLIQVVVEVHVGRAQAPTDQRRVRREHGRKRHLPLPEHRQRHRPLPLVEVGQHRVRSEPLMDLGQQVADGVTERNGLVDVRIAVRRADADIFPEKVLQLADRAHPRVHIDEQHLRPAGHQPPSAVNLDAARPQSVRSPRPPRRAAARLELNLRGRLPVGADQAVAVPPAFHRRRGLAAKHGVNPARLRTDFPGDLKQQR